MSDASKPRPTVRTIAAAAGVSAMTVSLALRNHPRISAATRAAVQAAAAKLGYRPDPTVAKLMHHLRMRQKPAFQASIAGLTTVAEREELPYLRDIVRSARQRAEELGYAFDLHRIGDAMEPRPDLQRIWRTRGVEGVVLLPVVKPVAVRALLDWTQFSVVTTTHAVLEPQFHRVVPNQFGNALQICRRLVERGYRRIGLVLPREHDVRVHHGFSGAVAWQNLIGGTELVRPLLHAEALPTAEELTAWFARERPDAIIAAGDKECRPIAQTLGLRVPGAVAFASANKSGRSVFAGIEERPEEIGAAAIEQLAGMIQRGEKGAPGVPKVTMVDGRWIAGRSVDTRVGSRVSAGE
ncbi:MAG: LacI family DNA-binding transcriptional regulator [Verrucomicrobiota bacterium]